LILCLDVFELATHLLVETGLPLEVLPPHALDGHSRSDQVLVASKFQFRLDPVQEVSDHNERLSIAIMAQKLF
jgi:hypothetical protein